MVGKRVALPVDPTNKINERSSSGTKYTNNYIYIYATRRDYCEQKFVQILRHLIYIVWEFGHIFSS